MMNEWHRSQAPAFSLATCSVSAFRPEMGVPIRTTVGSLRFFKFGPAENIPELAPKGIFQSERFANATDAEKESAYVQRLEEHADVIIEKLTSLSKKHNGRQLVLLCFENVRKGQICHRSWAADWFHERLDIEVAEVSPDN